MIDASVNSPSEQYASDDILLFGIQIEIQIICLVRAGSSLFWGVPTAVPPPQPLAKAGEQNNRTD